MWEHKIYLSDGTTMTGEQYRAALKSGAIEDRNGLLLARADLMERIAGGFKEIVKKPAVNK